MFCKHNKSVNFASPTFLHMNLNRTIPVSWIVVSSMILLAALSRLLPHWPNFTAVGAIALFGAAHLQKPSHAALVSLGALYLSDLIINNVLYAEYYSSFYWGFNSGVYAGFALVLGIGLLLRGRVGVATVGGAAVLSSLTFFLVTNAFHWWSSGMYPPTVAGLMMSYTAGLPFFWNTLLGDLFFSALLFGGYAWLAQQIKVLSTQQH